ncbi:uncharacterized protein LOC34620385, partial [Cyclospora cayetanensis]|uniref:Uncharacterized protein LOC34620385 n=1 Tax=Cyclospora cayetanensis TaxID=88456 RepID=A0A6P6S110_9EIME
AVAAAQKAAAAGTAACASWAAPSAASYLSRCATRLRIGVADKVESQPAKNLEADVAVILGNSSADLDSTVAAIGYAFALETCRLLQRGLSFDSSHQQQHEADLPAFLPLVDCSAADFRSRLQVGVAGRKWRQHVVSCVDHHVDKKALPAACKKRITGPCVGSCSSLVALLLEALQIHYSEILPPLPQDLAALLIGAIITDTVACRPDLSDLRWNIAEAAQGRQVYILLSLSPREGGSNQFDRQLALFAVAEESKRLEPTAAEGQLLMASRMCGSFYGCAGARAFLASCDNLRPEGDVKASPKRSLGEASTLSEAVVDPEGHVLGFCFFKVVGRRRRWGRVGS